MHWPVVGMITWGSAPFTSIGIPGAYSNPSLFLRLAISAPPLVTLLVSHVLIACFFNTSHLVQVILHDGSRQAQNDNGATAWKRSAETATIPYLAGCATLAYGICVIPVRNRYGVSHDMSRIPSVGAPSAAWSFVSDDERRTLE